MKMFCSPYHRSTLHYLLNQFICILALPTPLYPENFQKENIKSIEIQKQANGIGIQVVTQGILLLPYNPHNFSITRNCRWVIWINNDLFLLKNTKSNLKLLLYLKEYALQDIFIATKSEVRNKKI